MKTTTYLPLIIAMLSQISLGLGARATTYSETNTIICVGDSLTFGTGASTTQANCDNFHDGRLNGKTIPWSYPYRLAKRIGTNYNVLAQAKPGKCVDYMVAWMGGTGLATRQKLTLPAQKNVPVNFATNLVFTETFKNGWNWTRGHATAGNKWAGCGIPTLPLSEIGIAAGKNPCGTSPDSGCLDGWLGEIPVRIFGAYANTGLVIERLTDGTSVTLPANTPFVTKCEKTFRDAIYVIFGGYNDGYYGSGVNAYTNYVPLIKAAVAKIPSQRYIVISPHCKSTNDPSSQSQIEAAFAQAFGDHHLNLRTELDARGVAIAAQLGYTDTNWQKLFSDEVHFSSTGYEVLTYFVAEKLRALGYLKAAPAPSNPTYAKPYVAKWKGNRKGAYSYTFDDGIADQYTLAFPKLKEYGLNGTFFLIGEQMSNGRDNRFSWAQAKEMSDAGMEIGSHGYTHEYLTKMTRAETEVEIQKNIEAIEKYIGYEPKSFAYAYNQPGSYAQAILKEKGCYLSRLTQTDIGGWEAAKLDSEVNKCAANGTWGVGMIHGINSSYHPWSNPEELYRHWRHMSTNTLIWIDTFATVGIYKKLYEKTTVTITETGVNTWRISVSAPELDRNYYNGKLDLVLGDGTCQSFDPFAGDFTVTLGEPSEPTPKPLLSEFTQLEYISSTQTGGQYIDTGIPAQSNLTASLTLMINHLSTNDNTYALAAYDKDAEAYLVSLGKDKKWSWSLGNQSLARPVGPAFTTGVCYQITSTIGANARTMTFKVNNQTGPSYTAAQKGTSKYTLYLLGRNDTGTAGRFIDAKIYAAQLSITNCLVRDYIPCKSEKYGVGLFDRVEGVFYPSAAPNAPFVAGPPLSPSASLPIVNGKEIAVDKIFTVANSLTPITFPSAPRLLGTPGKDQTLSFESQTISIPTWYTAKLSGEIVTLDFTGKGAEPKLSECEFTTLGQFRIKNTNTQAYFWYSLGSKTNFLSEWNWSPFTQGQSTFEVTPHASTGFYKICVKDHP